ncbi:ribonuclease P protein component [Tessaracoccus flavus]|uniref:Ribonuclease P protein component n=1 Tax=Tessaracoccus flavus TaxID=1610493 RepID=A0A1Q2CHX9_9ACTN|nr:ribonuclease P protein component [Tessaracoccus flavus]AQP45717.1 ribonuclease P protein component [Tessaracoccus flavus]SDZ13047.1 ribonuclease P protein component [Tessaracoccus flavus]
MLPGPRRLKRPADFGATVRQGARAATPSVVVHVLRSTITDPPGTTRVGFVVSKKVGGAVTRNRVKRRLRHLTLELPTPFTADAVVRALPEAASSPELPSHLADAWRRAHARAA